MNAKEIGNALVKLCREGKNVECLDEYYAEDVVSVEAAPPPGGGEPVTRGIANVRKKGEWWTANNEVHGSTVTGPYPHGDDRFAVRFEYDVTPKGLGKRIQMDEIGLFTVKNGKIVKEEFFYDMG